MKRFCDICGIEADEHWMMPFNTGRRTMWLCWDCFKNSQYEVNMSKGYTNKKLYSIQQQKKRNK